MPNFSIALTGLTADSIALNTIGNNLANLNTTAFKEQTASFSDLFYQNIGVSGANTQLQVGGGTRIGDIETNFSQGSPSTTGQDTDMAINGDGFFVVNQGGTQYLTRDGSFQTDANGNLITSSGLNVMGYPSTNGVINGNTALSPLNIPTGQTQAAQATSSFSLGGVLDSSASVGTSFARSVDMYDSLGESHSVNISFTKTADNTWSYSVTLPGGDATAATGNTGTLQFDSNGNLVSPSGNISGIQFSGMSDASTDMNLTWQLYDANGNGLMTQTSTDSSINSTNQNGYPSGVYQSFSVDTSGVITALFSNGNNEQVGQVAIADVANDQGLTHTGSNLYLANQASGLASIGTAGTGGRGSVEGSSLEQSNVDISTEFSNLIIAQRAFEANSKTVTTFDTVTQETINMIR